MHMIQVIGGGIALLGIFCLFVKLWGADTASIALAAKLFGPAWLVIALINMWIGVTRAGYAVIQELPILFIVFAVPAALAVIVAWRLARH